MFARFDRRALGVLAALLLGLSGVAPVEAQGCIPFICYVDLGPSPAFICPEATVYPSAGRRLDPIVNTSVNPGCDVNFWKAAVVQVNVPAGCTGVTVLVEYAGVPEGFTVNIGDSETNDGFAGDAGSLPIGQNAELQVLHENLTVYSNAAAPPVDTLAVQHLALQDGALKFVVKDQSVSWGNPYSVLATPSLQKLFFLPPPGTGNRTVYVGLNRVISPVNGPNGFRNGCGARHAIMWVQ